MSSHHTEEKEHARKPALIQELMLGGLESLINAFIDLDADTQAQCRSREGLIVRVKSADPYGVFYVLFTDHGIELSSQSPGMAKVRVGGSAIAIVGALLGAITGTVAASVIAMGLISLPVMMRYGYNIRLATGVIAASGTITQLIPPSLVLVVLADQLGKSVGDMYAGAIGPSIVQVLLFCIFIFLVSVFKPEYVPALPKEARTLYGWPLIRRVLWGMVPSLVLIFLVLGTILMGVATPTEGGAMGAVGAIALAAMHKRLTWNLLWQGMTSTMRINAMVIFILIGSTVFGLVFRGVDGDLRVGAGGRAARTGRLCHRTA